MDTFVIQIQKQVTQDSVQDIYGYRPATWIHIIEHTVQSIRDNSISSANHI